MSPKVTDLTSYVQHAERYGPERILESAAADLPEGELRQLKAFIVSKERAFRWKQGRWIERTGVPKCKHCGLDLSPGVRAGTRYHPQCRTAAQKRRRTGRDPSDALPSPRRT